MKILSDNTDHSGIIPENLRSIRHQDLYSVLPTPHKIYIKNAHVSGEHFSSVSDMYQTPTWLKKQHFVTFNTQMARITVRNIIAAKIEGSVGFNQIYNTE